MATVYAVIKDTISNSGSVATPMITGQARVILPFNPPPPPADSGGNIDANFVVPSSVHGSLGSLNDAIIHSIADYLQTNYGIVINESDVVLFSGASR